MGDRLVKKPHLLAHDKEMAAKTAVWYWTSRDCGRYAEVGDFEAVCSLINRGEVVPRGPINGWMERLAAYERAKSLIGTEPVTEPAGERSEPVADRINQITLAYDKQGWAYDIASGLYVRSDTADLDHKTNKDGWLWAQVETAASTWSWPEANLDPWPGSLSYQDRHPTRYTWRDDVEAWARYLVDNYDCWVNTYYDHPEGYWRTETPFDVWGPAGRNDPLDPTLGDAIYDLLFNYEGKPDIDWIIWRRQIWTCASGVWMPWGEDPFTWHDDHIHTTYAL